MRDRYAHLPCPLSPPLHLCMTYARAQPISSRKPFVIDNHDLRCEHTRYGKAKNHQVASQTQSSRSTEATSRSPRGHRQTTEERETGSDLANHGKAERRSILRYRTFQASSKPWDEPAPGNPSPRVVRSFARHAASACRGPHAHALQRQRHLQLHLRPTQRPSAPEPRIMNSRSRGSRKTTSIDAPQSQIKPHLASVPHRGLIGALLGRKFLRTCSESVSHTPSHAPPTTPTGRNLISPVCFHFAGRVNRIFFGTDVMRRERTRFH
jgi:hypothetical protein